MNKELYDAYKNLNEAALTGLKSKLSDSPIALKLFHFLEKCNNRNFKNKEAVAFIYEDEIGGTDYIILENRYFKLRKKFFDEFFKPIVDDESTLTEEETELIRCRILLSKNEKDSAYAALLALEKHCFKKNIFELLPQILDQLIFCNQLLNKIERNTELFKRSEEAIALQSDLFKVIHLARKVYDINYKKGVKHALKELNLMKELADKNSKYPRFLMCYHYVSLYYKLGSADYIHDMQVISRHFKVLNHLLSLNPGFPLITYRKNFIYHQEMHHRDISAFYHYNRCEFEEAYRYMKESWVQMEKQPEVYGIYKSETIFFNLFNGEVATSRYREAGQTIEKYISFLRENHFTSKLSYAYTLKAFLVTYTWPDLQGAQSAFLKKQMEEYLRQIKGNENVQTSAAEVHLMKSRFFFLEGESDKARKLLNKIKHEKFIQHNGLFAMYEELYREDYSPAHLQQMKKLLQRKQTDKKNPVWAIHNSWIKKISG